MRGARWTGAGIALAGLGSAVSGMIGTTSDTVRAASLAVAIGLVVAGGAFAASPDRRGANLLLGGLGFAAAAGLGLMIADPASPGRGLFVAGAGLVAAAIAVAFGENKVPSVLFLRTGFALAAVSFVVRAVAPGDFGPGDGLAVAGFALAALAIGDAAGAFARDARDAGAPEPR
ncbi:MAG TPA: hypothetical protein VM889_03720 [Candidatus Thermoplasmatota archaeon]|nr:hypothetical protein [Candidatus Thermoplasmatota archaeon]